MFKEKRDIRFEDLFNGLDPEALKMDVPIQVPNEIYRELLDCSMERSYLDHVDQREHFPPSSRTTGKITWLQMTRLPVHPENVDSYDLFNRWQGVLSSLHAWGYRFLFLLQRREGHTHIYLGTMSTHSDFTSADAIEQIKEATSGSMPGVEILSLSPDQIVSDVIIPLQEHQCLGAITGLPSFFDEKEPGVLQTLDSLAFGIQGNQKDDRPYSLLVMADPINDRETSDIINRMRELGSKIHSDVERSVNSSQSKSESKQHGLNPYAAAAIGQGVSGLLGAGVGLISGALLPGLTAALGGLGSSAMELLGGALGIGIGQLNKNISDNYSLSVNTSYLDKFAKYAEELTEMHIERMKQGRNLGYWNVGVYVLGKNRKDVSTVGGMLRSIYAGRESFVEPIRFHILQERSGAMEIVRDQFQMIPLYNDTVEGMNEDEQWHVFGKHYQYLSTPMNTKELALTTSLPKRDVPGLRFVKTAVRFANNPPQVSGEDRLCLGNMVDMGVEQNAPYCIDLNDLVRHTLVCGSTGSGKSYTCKRILHELLKKEVPVLVIEPAKDDYVRWALEMNKALPEHMQFQIFMPGYDEFEGVPLRQLKLNPFEPAAVKGAKVDMMSRCENLVALLNASLPTDDILPVLVDETVYSHYQGYYRSDFTCGRPMEQQEVYPPLSTLTEMAKYVLNRRNYEAKVRDNLTACLQTRFQYLTRGTRGQLLDVDRSTDWSILFDRPTVINISGISAAKDKALIMSLLMLSLYEYRKSQYAHDPVYRSRASQNKLQHITLVEEAHNVLLKPEGSAAGSGNPQQVVADLFSNMLSEIRSYGQGLMIVDQVPTRLIPDAIKNTNYKIVHRLTAPDDCEIMSASLALRPDQQSLIPALSQGYAVVCGDKDDAAAWLHMKPSDATPEAREDYK